MACRRARDSLWLCMCVLLPLLASAAPPHAVQLYLHDNLLDNGWTALYYQPYSHGTTLADIVAPSGYAASGYCMLMGAKTSASSNTLALAAIVDADTFDNPTSLNSPRYSRGVYWHMTDGKSCGFSADPELSQSSADTATRYGQYRVSWHLHDGVGGYRAGETLGLNSDSTWTKVVYFAATNCESLNNDYSVPYTGPPLGVQLGMPDAFAWKGWTLVYDQPYSHATQPSDMPSATNECVFFGAKASSAATTFTLGAFADAVSAVSTTTKNFPRESRGVWWYATSPYSIGFSAHHTVHQGQADTASWLPEKRLSWHYGLSSGGFRAGVTTGLNSDSTWRKAVWKAPVSCANVPADYNVDTPGTTEFPNCASFLAGPRCSCTNAGSGTSEFDMSLAWEAGNQRFAVQLTNPHGSRHVQAVALGSGRCKVLRDTDFSCTASSTCPCTALVSWASFVDACYAGQGLDPADRQFIVPLFVQWREYVSGSGHVTYQREQSVRIA